MLSNIKDKVSHAFGKQSSKQLIGNTNTDGIDIVYEDISYSVQVPDEEKSSFIPCKKQYKEKQILKGISGIFKAGKVSAIMGASGAGKTTLLNILACRINPKENGKLYANNLQYDYNTFGDFANYVMQNDVLMQTMTVRETLEFAAQLKLNLPEEERKDRVIELANQLKLEKCLDTMIGGVILKGVSGGEKKRVSIAFELMSDPQVIFLDEPTSGLDSLTSYIIVSQLKKLAHKRNKTIIMTIHQPNSEIYGLFDNLTLLLEGQIIYQDKASQVTDYFQTNFKLTCPEFTNPSDFFMSKIHYEDEKNRALYSEYFQVYDRNQKQPVMKMIKNKETSNIALRQVNVSYVSAMSALTHRNVLNTIRNPMLFKAKFGQSIFMSIFIGGLFFDIGTRDYTDKNYWNSITGFLFFMTISAMMTTLSPLSLTFPLERNVFFKQQDSKMYNTVQYFVSRNIVEIPQLILFPLICAAIYYFMIDLSNSAQQFFVHVLVFMLIAFAGASLGLLLGSLIFDAKSVSAVIPIVIVPFILFSGFFKNRESLPVWLGWFEYISPNKYGFIGFLENEVAYKASRIDNLEFDLTKWEAIIVLFCLGIFFRLLSLFFLWFLRKKSQ